MSFEELLFQLVPVAGNKAKSQLPDAQTHPASCTLVASPGVVLLPWCCAVCQRAFQITTAISFLAPSRILSGL